MCWEMDYPFWAEQQKKAAIDKKQEQRADIIDQLLNEANKQADTTVTEDQLAKEVTPAK